MADLQTAILAGSLARHGRDRSPETSRTAEPGMGPSGITTDLTTTEIGRNRDVLTRGGTELTTDSSVEMVNPRDEIIRKSSFYFGAFAAADDGRMKKWLKYVPFS